MNEQSETSRSEGAPGLPIYTGRLVLRAPEPEDAGPLSEIANNMAIASQMSRLPHPYSEKDAESWIAETRANTSPHNIALVITLKDGALAGATGISTNDNGEPEITYFLGESHWGEGLASEAARGIIDFAFAATDIKRIVGCCAVANRGSRGVLEKCGFRFSRTGTCNCSALKASLASEEFVLERALWESRKQGGRK